MNKIILTIFISLITSMSFSQPVVDGFLKGQGNIDVVGGYYFDSYKKYYANDGLINLERNTQIISFYAAGGITPWLDVQVSLPFIIAGPNKILQDASVYFKTAIINTKQINKGKLSILYVPGVSLPTNNYPTEGLYAVGQRASLIDQRLVIQYFMDNGMFMMGQTGYSYRFTPVPSSIPLAVKIGLAKEKYYIDVWYDYQYAKSGRSYGDGLFSSFREFKVSYSKVGITLYKPLNDRIGIAFGNSYVLNGENVGKSVGFSGAIIIKG